MHVPAQPSTAQCCSCLLWSEVTHYLQTPGMMPHVAPLSSCPHVLHKFLGLLAWEVANAWTDIWARQSSTKRWKCLLPWLQLLRNTDDTIKTFTYCSEGGGAQYIPSYAAPNLPASTVAHFIQAGMQSTQLPSPFCIRNFTFDPWGIVGWPLWSDNRTDQTPNWSFSMLCLLPSQPLKSPTNCAALQCSTTSSQDNTAQTTNGK